MLLKTRFLISQLWNFSVDKYILVVKFAETHSYLTLPRLISGHTVKCAICLMWKPCFRRTLKLRIEVAHNKIVDHSDVVGASPVSAAPTTSSFSTWHLASMGAAYTRCLTIIGRFKITPEHTVMLIVVLYIFMHVPWYATNTIQENKHLLTINSTPRVYHFLKIKE